MNDKLTIREWLVCRILILVARILGRELPEELRKELAGMETQLYIRAKPE